MGEETENMAGKSALVVGVTGMVGRPLAEVSAFHPKPGGAPAKAAPGVPGRRCPAFRTKSNHEATKPLRIGTKDFF